MPTPSPEVPQDVQAEPSDSPAQEEEAETAGSDAEAEETGEPEPTEDVPAQSAAPQPAASAAPSPSAAAPSQTVEPEEPDASTPSPTPALVYQNGTFTGSGEGYWGTITVSVSIQDDVITAIDILSSDDDEPYFTNAKAVISRILTLQSTNVDAVSGATYSSYGILDAVEAALARAKN